MPNNSFFSAEEWGNIAKSVLSFLRHTMKEICSTYPKYSGTRSKVGLKCDLCTEENTPCDRHQKEGCTSDDCVCILSLGHLLKKAPSCKRNLLNKRNFLSSIIHLGLRQKVRNFIMPAHIQLIQLRLSQAIVKCTIQV